MDMTLNRHRFTVAEYHRLAEVGILRPDERVELIEGEIVSKAAIGSRHAGRVSYLGEELGRVLGSRALVRVQHPVRLGDISEPEPDIAVVYRRPDFYDGGHPGPQDVRFVIEVAESSADTDRTVKGPLYARAGIPEFWLVDLTANAIEIYRAPELSGWRERRIARPGERIAPAAFPDAGLDVDAALGSSS